MLKYLVTLTVSIAFFASGCTLNYSGSKQEVKILPPEKLYGQLFYDVQSNENIFKDSKTFVDCNPKYNVEQIKKRYTSLFPKTDSALRFFINQNFYLPEQYSDYKTDSSSINEHISKLWEVLKRPADANISGTRIPLPNPYIVPGGRFREVYYWDSYFTFLGLQQDSQISTIEAMIENFSYLINTYGYIPNGNRTYYLGRSQPPFFTLMIALLAESKGEDIYKKYLKSIEKEYLFWMNGTEKLNKVNRSYRRDF